MPAPDLSDRTLAQLVSLAGRTAIVTGGADGIGRAVAARLLEAGATVAVTSRDEDRAKAAAAELCAAGGTAIGIGLELRCRSNAAAAVNRAADELGGLDILVNNAAVYPFSPALATSDEQWDDVLGVDLHGAFACSRAAADHMVEAGRGVIVNVLSLNSFRAGLPGQSAYTVAKHGLAGLTKSLAVELGRSGVRVVGVAPSGVDTPGMRAAIPALDALGLGDVAAQIAASMPLGRLGVPDDVARVVLFAASDLAGFTTGSTILVDGGFAAL